MKIGLMGLNMGAAATDPSVARDLAILAESLGYDSLWVGDHPVLPSPPLEGSPFSAGFAFGAPLVALAHLIAHTTDVLLATGVLLVPQRGPVHLAKELATLDVLSGGRLVFGVGVGYLETEFRAVGVPLAGRGRRTDEYLSAMRELWSSPRPTFEGDHVSFDGIEVLPVPTRPGGPPIVVGGESDAAFDRAARVGDGWLGWFLSPDRAARRVERLRARARFDRARLEISVMPSERLNPDNVRAFVEAGVDRLVVTPSAGMNASRVLRFVERNAPAALEIARP